MTTTAYGIDLSGYVANRTVCAMAQQDDDRISISILTGSPFSGVTTGATELGPRVEREMAALRTMMASGSVAVDVPIDLQGLPAPALVKHVRDLTMRPIDVVLSALPPLANLIGALTARFANLAKMAGIRSALGVNLFETYPGGTRKILNWQGVGPLPQAGISREEFCSGWDISGLQLTSDEIDASICAVTALRQNARCLEGADLAEKLLPAFNHHAVSPSIPEGFLLLVEAPKVVSLRKLPFHDVVSLR